MCNLYSLTPKEDDVGRYFRVSHNRRATFKPVNAIFPRHVAPVVRQSEDGEREIVLMSWGFLRLEKGTKPVTMSGTIRSRPIPSGATVSGSDAAWYRPPRSASQMAM
jgi:putative SOS response-associated peptidase YedK